MKEYDFTGLNQLWIVVRIYIVPLLIFFEIYQYFEEDQFWWVMATYSVLYSLWFFRTPKQLVKNK